MFQLFVPLFLGGGRGAGGAERIWIFAFFFDELLAPEVIKNG